MVLGVVYIETSLPLLVWFAAMLLLFTSINEDLRLLKETFGITVHA